MKRILIALVCFLMLAAMLPLHVFALFGEPDPDGYVNTFGYNRIASGTEAEIIGYYGLGGEETIPETAGGLPITSVKIGGINCPDDAQITVLHLPASLQNFSADSLQNCHDLEAVTISEESPYFKLENGMLLTADGTKVVLCPAASSAETVAVPEGVTAIGVQAFADCTHLKRILFPDTLAEIESGVSDGQNRGAFENCVSLEKLRFPMGIRKIGNYAFFGCSALNEVVILDDAETSIGLDAFFGCPNLRSVMLPSGVRPIGAESFGYLPGIEDPADTRKVDGFTIYGVNSTPAKSYATQNGFEFVKLDIFTDMFNDVRITGPIPNIGGFSASQITDEERLDVLRAYFTPEDLLQLYRYQVNPKKDTEILQPFACKAHYCAPLPEELSEENLYVFRLQNGLPEFLDSDCCPGTDWMGNPTENLYVYFEADTAGDVFFVNGTSEPGHVLGNEEIRLEDLTTLAKYIAGWSIFPRLLNCDVTGDGAIRVSDLTVLAKHIAGWDVTLLPFAGAI